MPLLGATSRPPSPLASLPPDVDVPLPLGFEPVVDDVPEAELVLEAELAAGSPDRLVAVGPAGLF
jgi:hypothetical protein